MRKYFYLQSLDRYVSDSGETISREYGRTPNGNNLNGAWVYRDKEGNFIDFNQYLSDLCNKYFIVLDS